MQTSDQAKIDDFTARGWWGDRTVTDAFAEAVGAVPSRTALIDAPNRAELAFGPPRRLTFAEAEADVARLARALFAAGVRRSDRVLVQLPNIGEIVLTYIAVARLGAIISPVPMQYGRHELAAIAASLEPTAIVSLTRFKGEDVAALHRTAFSRDATILSFGPAPDGDIRSLDVMMADNSCDDAYRRYIQDLKVSGNDIYTVCWTSGTTGRPKGVPRSYNHWFNQSFAMDDAVHLQDGDVLLNPFPFVNMAAISGFLFVWLFARGTLVLHHPFDLPLMLKQLQDERVVYTVVPPAALNMLLAKKELLAGFDLSRLRTICSGSAPLSPWMVKGFKDLLNIDVVNTFGSNEGIALISCGEDVPSPEQRALYFPRFGVPGIAWKNRIADRMQTRLVDPESGEVIAAPGRPGELCIKGPNVFDGYWRSPEDNALVFDRDGFFRTGDMLEIVGDTEPPRFYRFVGRCKDIINRGGMKISPEEIDTLLVSHPKIAECAVFGEPDAIMGERVSVAAVAKPGVDLTLEDIAAYLKDKDVAIFKCPERLVSVAMLPRNPLGKVVRAELRRVHGKAAS